MAALELLLAQARRHSFLRTHSQLSLLIRSNSSQPSSLPWFHRSFSSSSALPTDPNPAETPVNNEPSNRRTPSVTVQPVSYPVKPKDISNSPPQEVPPQNPVNADARIWTREDIRYVKDLSEVSGQSSKVAPLPEDRSTNEGEGRGNEELEAERRRIEADNRVFRRILRVEEQQKVVPFPTLIKVEEETKKKEKVVHDLKEAIQLVKASAKRNFDETVEAHVKLAVDLRRTDLKLNGSVSLPHGSGKSFRVAVFAEGALADEARAAGADVVGGQELIEGIKNGSVNVKDIDKCIAVPQLMPRIGKEISKKLNRLTPNAKDGSVTTDISRAVKEAKKNIAFKKDKSAIVHVGLGKVSYTEEALSENIGAFVNALLVAKPVGLKKSSKYAGYVNTFHICSTMGPSFPVSIQSLSIAADRYNKLQVR